MNVEFSNHVTVSEKGLEPLKNLCPEQVPWPLGDSLVALFTPVVSARLAAVQPRWGSGLGSGNGPSDVERWMDVVTLPRSRVPVRSVSINFMVALPVTLNKFVSDLMEL